MAHSTPRSQSLHRSRNLHSKRATPYNTPRSHISKFVQDKHEVQDRSSLRELVQKTWITYKATPMINFSYAAEKLKEYSSHLSTKFEVNKAKNLGMFVGAGEMFKAEITTIPGLAFTNDENEALKISVMTADKGGKTVQQFRNIQNDKREVFCGILCCVKGSKKATDDLKEKKNFTILPVFLAKGNLEFVKCVVEFFQTNFHCYISPMQFNSFELAWQAAMWAVDYKNDISPRHLQLVYALPWKKLHTIEYDISATTIAMVWKRIHDIRSSQVFVEEVNSLIDALNKHFFHVFGIRVDNFPLTQITTQAAAVHSSGKLKILSEAAVHQVLYHLTTIAQELLL